MNVFKIKKFERNLNSDDLEQLGFSNVYTEAMLLKANDVKLKIYDLTVIQANILKQTALSNGCDCAIHSGCLNNSVEKTDAILFGSKSKIIDIIQKLKLQQFKMPLLADELYGFLKGNEPQKPKIMGILNLTEDSFSDGGKYLEFDKAIEHAAQMIEQGADIIDIGAESTKPYSEAMPSDIQIKRIMPVFKELVNLYPNMEFSIDTRSSEVANEVFKVKNVIINDVSGLEYDKNLVDVIIKNQAKIVVCHSSSTPCDMQEKTNYDNLIDDIFKFFVKKTEALSENLPKENIILDVGFGFGKTVEQNFELIKKSDEFLSLGFPLLAGVSRKSFIQKTVPDADYDNLTSALCAELLLKGVSVFRVHDVKKTKDAIELFSALL